MVLPVHSFTPANNCILPANTACGDVLALCDRITRVVLIYVIAHKIQVYVFQQVHKLLPAAIFNTGPRIFGNWFPSDLYVQHKN